MATFLHLRHKTVIFRRLGTLMANSFLSSVVVVLATLNQIYIYALACCRGSVDLLELTCTYSKI